ncbi:MAG: GAF domain-containing protein [Bacteroidia bacterium]
MAEDIIIEQNLSKQEKYDSLLLQIKALIEGEIDVIANLSNIIAALKYGMNWFWVGIYFVKKNNEKNIDELVLGTFQGPVACTRIAFGKGVCGTAWKNKEVIIVDDVDLFPGHIACSSFSKSEIVLPIYQNQEVVMILDVDSDAYATFDKTDEANLLKVISLIENLI